MSSKASLMRFMGRIAVAVCALLVATALQSVAAAQGVTTIDVPPQQAPDKRSYEEYRRDELKVDARRSRNALIGLSAATAVGAALLFPGAATQCQTITRLDGTQEVQCSRAGRALVGTGWPLFIGGLTGVLISGIMFGVRQGKVRRLNKQIEYKKRALRWDPQTSQFVF